MTVVEQQELLVDTKHFKMRRITDSDTSKDRELELGLPPQLRAKDVTRIWYDVKQELVSISQSGKTFSIKIQNLIENGVESFDELVNGDLDEWTKEGIKNHISNLVPIVTKKYNVNNNGNKTYIHNTNNNDQVISVLEAKRVHSGNITVLGTIVGISDSYIINTGTEESPIHRNARSIQLVDTENLNTNERLGVILYDNEVENIIVGETVKVSGNMRIQYTKEKSKKGINILDADSIQYLNKKEIIITDRDIESFHRFAKLPKLTKGPTLIQRLTNMFAPNIYGCDEPKLGTLRAIVGGTDHHDGKGNRLDTLHIGDVGCAKTDISKEAIKVKDNSKFVDAGHSTTKTITAVPEKANDNVSVIYGAIPLARNSICVIDEIDAFPIEEQGRLLEVIEGGKIHLDKLGRHSEIDSPTTIIATANPNNGKWSYDDRITKEEINLKQSLLDRFSQVYCFRDNIPPKEFAAHMLKIQQRRYHNYKFLKKYLMYASGIEVKFTEEASMMLSEFWVNGKETGIIGNRMYKDIFKIAEAQAKLELRNEVDEEIAKQTIESVQTVMLQYGVYVKMVSSPKVETFNTFKDILQNTLKGTGITIPELHKIACERNDYIKSYLGKNEKIEKNKRLRTIVAYLRNNSHVVTVSTRPIILKWKGDND